MLERFLDHFTSETPGLAPTRDTSVMGLMTAVGAHTFGDGVYRVHDESSAAAAHELVVEAFPQLRGRVTCFGYDWLGNQFATDTARGEPHDPEVLLVEVGAGELLQVPVPFSRFHDEELVEETEAALARSFFERWLESGGRAPDPMQCVGYRVPLFLGGADDLPNLELVDLEVYWTLTGQLWRQVGG